MNISDAFASFQELATDIPADDTVMMSEAWNNYTDSLCKDRELTDLQYHYCPAVDDDMPADADDEREYILDQMGVKMSSVRTDTRPDAEEWGTGANHWSITLTRGSDTLTTHYSTGSAVKGSPDRSDVLNCLIMDWQSVDNCDGFEDWAEELGFDTDSRRAEKSYHQCVEQSEQFANMFRDVAIDDLAALFEDY